MTASKKTVHVSQDGCSRFNVVTDLNLNPWRRRGWARGRILATVVAAIISAALLAPTPALSKIWISSGGAPAGAATPAAKAGACSGDPVPGFKFTVRCTD